MSETGPRHIWLCADDYGISPGVNRAIRQLLTMGRINATSVMMVGPAIGRDEVKALTAAADSQPGAAIGLHVTLTAPFYPLSLHFAPLAGGMFLPLAKKLQSSLLRRYDREIVRAEIAAQLAAFKEAFGRLPDYVDGHQHVQLFPQIRDAFLSAVQRAAPHAWVRQCGRNQALTRRLSQPKALLLDSLSVQFRARAHRAGIAFNPGFAGAYDFGQTSDFGAHMRDFLDGLPDGGLVMCHPGYVDQTLISLDPVTDQRERELAYLAGDAFARLLAEQQVRLS
ncbi:MAG: ChbG/HpnK family deacetylase [Rhodopseudomonas palustris]|nr:MAG: ChbG/HpnK family deacetylase [Rhodopseudomonas palustris]